MPVVTQQSSAMLEPNDVHYWDISGKVHNFNYPRQTAERVRGLVVLFGVGGCCIYNAVDCSLVRLTPRLCGCRSCQLQYYVGRCIIGQYRIAPRTTTDEDAARAEPGISVHGTQIEQTSGTKVTQ